jgi:hypothetical protein
MIQPRNSKPDPPPAATTRSNTIQEMATNCIHHRQKTPAFQHTPSTHTQRTHEPSSEKADDRSKEREEGGEGGSPCAAALYSGDSDRRKRRGGRMCGTGTRGMLGGRAPFSPWRCWPDPASPPAGEAQGGRPHFIGRRDCHM